VEQIQHEPSREAAVCESPARECRVKWKNRRESRRDDTRSHARSIVLSDIYQRVNTL